MLINHIENLLAVEMEKTEMNFRELTLAGLSYPLLALLIAVFFYNSDLVANNIIFILIGLFVISEIKMYRYSNRMKRAVPVVSIPDEDKTTILTLLFKIRCAEIRNIYSTLKTMQKQANENDRDWFALFLEDHLFPWSPYHNTAGATDKQKELVSKLVEEKFYISEWKGTRNRSRDIIIALWLKNRKNSYEKLWSLKTIGVFQSTVDFLINEYEALNTTIGLSPFLKDNFCNYFLRPKTLYRYIAIEFVWQEIIRALKASLLYAEQKNGSLTAQEEQLMEQVNALTDIIDHFNYLIAHKNITEYSIDPYTMEELEQQAKKLDADDLIFDKQIDE